MSLADDYSDLQVNAYFSLVSFTILFYDWFITLGDEISRLWFPGDYSWAVILFFINRYLGIFGHVVVLVEYFWTGYPANKETSLQSFHQYFAILIQLVVAIMLIMRTYALYDRSLKIAIVQVTTALVVIALGCYAILSGKKNDGDELADMVKPYIGCPVGLTRDAAIRLGSAWTGMLVFDILVFYLTLRKALMLNRRGGVSLLKVLLRDGSIYFGVLACANLANILTFFLADKYLRGTGTTFTNVIATTIVSRLMLNLRDPKLSRTPMSTTITDYPLVTTLDPSYYTSMGTRAWDAVDEQDERDPAANDDIELAQLRRHSPPLS